MQAFINTKLTQLKSLKSLPVDIIARGYSQVNKSIDLVLSAVVKRALSSRRIQNVVVGSVSCSTPIGQALNHHIEGMVEDVDRELDADEVKGLDRFVENSMEDWFRHNEIEPESIRNFDRAVSESVESALEDNLDDYIKAGIEKLDVEGMVERAVDSYVARLVMKTQRQSPSLKVVEG